ncbi:MAG: hypothetical protein GY945_04695 [Rhodobacteraceae bacterium]|nr:hypothetical protein [Paracoccaceae bacterium]
MIADIWGSFRRLPLWVQVWVALILVPVNLASLAFVGLADGRWVALFAVGGMLPNVAIMIRERGLSKAMALPHLVIWIPLVGVVAWILLMYRLFGSEPSTNFMTFLMLLLVTDLISLGFDVPDAWKWWKGSRDIA